MFPEDLCGVDGGICVFDSSGKRIIVASNDDGLAEKQLIDEGYLGKNNVSALMTGEVKVGLELKR